MAETTDFFTANAELGDLPDVLDVASMERLIKLEVSGEDFYLGVADRIGNEEAAELLRRNGREEVGHAKRLQRAIAIKLGRDYEPAAEVLERYPVPLPDHISPKLLLIIVQGELAGDASYQRYADNEPDPEVARLLRLNGREETKHGERVKQVMAILEAAAPAPEVAAAD